MKVWTWMISFMRRASGALNKHDNEPFGSIKLREGEGGFLDYLGFCYLLKKDSIQFL
jgi:hypothetical protein